jgi:hypothetical protein
MPDENVTQQEMRDGDVIEIDGVHGPVTALVLLANDSMAILDFCDGSTPFVVEYDELASYRVFVDTPLAAVA